MLSNIIITKDQNLIHALYLYSIYIWLITIIIKLRFIYNLQ